MQQAMEARAAAFNAALHQTRRTAVRLQLGDHMPTRIRLAAVFAQPAANYGDAVWSTNYLQPSSCFDNPVQKAYMIHMKQAIGVPKVTPNWPLLGELGLQPTQRQWWQHTIRFYNTAVHPVRKQRSPLVAAALSADMEQACREQTQRQEASTAGVQYRGVTAAKHSWSGQLLAALEALEQGLEAPTLQQAARELRPLPGARVLELVDAAYQLQQHSGGEDPRDPAADHRQAATYAAWFQPTAGRVLEHAAGRTSSRECDVVRANLRLRLGAVKTAVTQGQRSGSAFGQRICQKCRHEGREHIGDVQHLCLECLCVRRELGRGPPGDATCFVQLYNGNLRRAMEYVADVVAKEQ